MEENLKASYLKKLKERKIRSRTYKKYQFIGLELARILNDNGHKSLYIKLAKDRDNEELLRLAKETAERPNIDNKGAYFMRMLSGTKFKI